MGKKKWWIMILALPVLFSGSAFGTDMSDADNPSAALSADAARPCIRVSMIKELDIPDNQTIVFHMRNHKSWINNLPYPCPQLYHEGGIAYRVDQDRLCHVDIISVVNHPGMCGLGLFEPYDTTGKENS